VVVNAHPGSDRPAISTLSQRSSLNDQDTPLESVTVAVICSVWPTGMVEFGDVMLTPVGVGVGVGAVGESPPPQAIAVHATTTLKMAVRIISACWMNGNGWLRERRGEVGTGHNP
jgi:hypothetical protein